MVPSTPARGVVRRRTEWGAGENATSEPVADPIHQERDRGDTLRHRLEGRSATEFGANVETDLRQAAKERMSESVNARSARRRGKVARVRTVLPEDEIQRLP